MVVFKVFLAVLAILPCTFATAENVKQPNARIVIQVGMGIRPPFLDASGTSGAGVDILVALNKVQSKFKFVHRFIPAMRTQESIARGWVDISMWDNPKWGWKDGEVSPSKALVASRDVYITRKSATKTQAFFEKITDKKLAVVNGYHYKIFKFENAPKLLDQLYDVSLVGSEEAVIKKVLANRSEVGIVSETALNWYFKQHPEASASILVSDKSDTQYKRYFLIADETTIKVEELNRFLKIADENQLLTPIYHYYRLPKPSFN